VARLSFGYRRCDLLPLLSSRRAEAVDFQHQENPVTVQLNEHLKRDQEVARKALHVAVTSLMFLARQGLAIRGNCHHGGNFYQLMRLRSADVPEAYL